jgi:hypothetical protein
VTAPAFRVGDRVLAIVDYDAEQPTGTVRSIDEGRKGPIALVALDHAEPGIGRQVVVSLGQLRPLAPEVDDEAHRMARYTPRDVIAGWVAGLRAEGDRVDELAVCERALEIADARFEGRS